MVRDIAVIANTDGLHARPVAEFVRVAASAGHDVKLSRIGQTPVRGDSILAILALGLRGGERVQIEVSGTDETELLTRLLSIVGKPKSD